MRGNTAMFPAFFFLLLLCEFRENDAKDRDFFCIGFDTAANELSKVGCAAGYQLYL